jgi:hypothetical protein
LFFWRFLRFFFLLVASPVAVEAIVFTAARETSSCVGRASAAAELTIMDMFLSAIFPSLVIEAEEDSELTTEPFPCDTPPPPAGRVEKDMAAGVLVCANLQESPLRQPAGEAKKAQGGLSPAGVVEKSLYFFAQVVMVLPPPKSLLPLKKGRADCSSLDGGMEPR